MSAAVPLDQLIPTNQKQAKVSTQVMVDNALKSLNERSGSSVIAIKKFLVGTYGIDVEKSSRLIKKYIKESVDIGKIIQTKGSGLNGSFKLSAAALKGPKPKKKIKSKVGAETKEKKPKEVKGPKKATKDGATKGEESAGKKEIKKATETKSSKVPKMTAAVLKKKTTNKPEPTKKKPTKKQETQTPKKKVPAEKKVAKVPAKNSKGKENIPPTKGKPQAKKKEETVAVAPPVPEPATSDEESDYSENETPEIQIKQALSFEEPPSEEEAKDPESEGSESEEEMEPLLAEMDDPNSSDESVAHESSPEIPKAKAKGKVAAKSTKKRKSIATLVNPAKPKITKK